MYVNMQNDAGEDHELTLEVERDLDWMAVLTIQDRETADIIDTWTIEADEVPAFLSAVERFRIQWERQTSAAASEPESKAAQKLKKRP